jgi:HTH-type transcriptional regulator/antitoxin HigA
VEFEEFNTRIEAGKNGVSLLRVLMQQRGFSQSDFENEIATNHSSAGSSVVNAV